MHSLGDRVRFLLCRFGIRVCTSGGRIGMDAEYLGSGVTLRFASLVPTVLKIRFRFLLPDLTPNPGLWWYFFTEMFDHFRPFFLMVFSVSAPPRIEPVLVPDSL